MIISLLVLVTTGAAELKTIAHMGASQEAPENTISAFKKAWELGADFIEFDVRTTKDGIPVVIHDGSVGWDWEIPESYPVKSLTFEELQRFDLGKWFSSEFTGERVPSLERVLALGGNYMVEIKWQGEPFHPYVDQIIPHVDKESCVVGCMIPTVVEYLKSQGFRTVGIVQSVPNLERFVEIAPDILALRLQLINPETIQRLHDLGIEVWGWTIDDVAQGHAFGEMGLDGVITNNVRGMKMSKERSAGG